MISLNLSFIQLYSNFYLLYRTLVLVARVTTEAVMRPKFLDVIPTSFVGINEHRFYFINLNKIWSGCEIHGSCSNLLVRISNNYCNEIAVRWHRECCARSDELCLRRKHVKESTGDVATRLLVVATITNCLQHSPSEMCNYTTSDHWQSANHDYTSPPPWLHY